MPLGIADVIQKYLPVWIALLICLLPIAICTPATSPVSNGGEPAIYQMEIDLLGTRHEVSVDSQGRLKTTVQVTSADGTVSLSAGFAQRVLESKGISNFSSFSKKAGGVILIGVGIYLFTYLF